MKDAATDTIWTSLMGLELEQKYLDVGGVRTRCMTAGSGEVLLLLHGGGGHLEAYARNIAALAARFQVWAVDLIGHGYSDRPAIGAYSFRTMVNYIRDLHAAITPEPINLAGLSIGAMSGAVYAGENPGRVLRLLLNTGVPLLADEQGRTRWRASIEQRRKVSDEGTWTRESVLARLGRVFHAGEADVPAELVEVRYRIYTQPGFTRYNNALVENLLREIIEGNQFTTIDGPNALRNLACPTLLLWTTVNPGQGIGVAQAALDLVPRGKLVVFERSGHWPQWEESGKYNELCLDFMSDAA